MKFQLFALTIGLSIAFPAYSQLIESATLTSVSSLSDSAVDLPRCAQREPACNCSDFSYQEDAQKIFDRFPNDPFGLDGIPGSGYSGTEGKACERLPSKNK